MKKVKAKSYALRIDAHLVEPLQKLKKHNRRSLNAEINAALEQWVSKAVKPAAKKKAAAASAPEAKPAAEAAASEEPRRSKTAQRVGAARLGSDPASNGESD